jgi:hypothetical protein
MKALKKLLQLAIRPFILIAAIFLMILDVMHVNITPLISYIQKAP